VGKEILVPERLGDVFREKCRPTYLGKKKGENVKFYVKVKNLESMTKKVIRNFDEKTYLLGKSHMEKCNLGNFSSV